MAIECAICKFAPKNIEELSQCFLVKDIGIKTKHYFKDETLLCYKCGIKVFS